MCNVIVFRPRFVNTRLQNGGKSQNSSLKFVIFAFRTFSTCTVETVCCFLPQCGQLKKHGKNQIKSKKTCFFLFLFCFLTVFLICTFVQNYNRTGRKLKTQIDTTNTSVQLQSPVEMLKRFNSLILK